MAHHVIEYVTGASALELRYNSSIEKDQNVATFVMSLFHSMESDVTAAKLS